MRSLIMMLCIPCIIFAGTPKAYTTQNYQVMNGHLFLITTHFVPSVKTVKVPVQKSYYKGGRLFAQKVVIEKRLLVRWRQKTYRRKIK
ncbi:MAG: hypothetical protein ACM3Q2_15165 [Syntrophothermus sp.]